MVAGVVDDEAAQTQPQASQRLAAPRIEASRIVHGVVTLRRTWGLPPMSSAAQDVMISPEALFLGQGGDYQVEDRTNR